MRKDTFGWGLGLFGLVLLFWKLRIIDAATRAGVILGNHDIHAEHYPMTKYGFEALASGRLPLWNPFQLTGTPFLAVPHVGLLYPGNWLYLFIDAARGTELSFILHLFWGGFGSLLLMRSLGLSKLAGTVAGLTFMWSGWMIDSSNQSALVAGMCWLPITVFLIERTVRGHRMAGVGLALAVGCQILNGATEFFVHNMYAGGGFAAFRLAHLWWNGEPRAAVARGAGLLGAVMAGALLASPQLLASLELASTSVRSGRPLTFEQATFLGTIAPGEFLSQALRTTGLVTVGVLPFAGLALGLGARQRSLWAFFAVLGIVAVLLAFGGEVYRLYFHTPFGGLFRRPNKFLHLYAFAQSGMAALCVAWLETHAQTARLALWRAPVWIAALVLLGGACAWGLWAGEISVAFPLLLGTLVVWACLPAGRARSVALVACVCIQGTSLFFGVHQDFVRPAAQPHLFHVHDDLLDELAARVGDDRVHITRDFQILPGLMQKVGSVRGLRVIGDYEPLASQRAGEYFERIAPPRDPTVPFTGRIYLSPDSKWSMMDLAAARWYVVLPGTPTDRFLAARAEQTRGAAVQLIRDGTPRLYERRGALARARFVPEARFFDDPDAVLDTLAALKFDPSREVLIERIEGQAPPAATDVGGESAGVDIAVDDPERVELVVDAPRAGWVVLADAWHASWRAEIDGAPVPIWRANYLFRAIPVEAGQSRIVFTFHSPPFRTGLAAAGVTLAVLAGLALRFRRNNETGAATLTG